MTFRMLLTGLAAAWTLGAEPGSAAVVEYHLAFPNLTLTEGSGPARSVSAEITAFADRGTVTQSWTDPSFAGWTTGWQEAQTGAMLIEIEGLDAVWLTDTGTALAWTDFADMLSSFHLSPGSGSVLDVAFAGMPYLNADSGGFAAYDWTVDLSFATAGGAATLTSGTNGTSRIAAFGPLPTLTTRITDNSAIPAPVPLPAAGWLFLTVLAGIGMLKRR